MMREDEFYIWKSQWHSPVSFTENEEDLKGKETKIRSNGSNNRVDFLVSTGKDNSNGCVKR